MTAGSPGAGWAFSAAEIFFGSDRHDGYIYFKGQQTEVVQKGKDTIYIRDIEQVANSHPNIIETVVIPISNGNISNIEFKIFAFKVNNHSLTHEEFSDYLYQNLNYFHVPRFIEFREDLPRSPTTAFLKRLLKRKWDDEESRSSTWDTQIHDFLK